MKAIIGLCVSLCACAQWTGVQNGQHRTLAYCAGTFRAIEQITTATDRTDAAPSVYAVQSSTFAIALSDVSQSLSITEQQNLAALEQRGFSLGIETWDGAIPSDGSGPNVLNGLELLRLQRQCANVLSA